MNTLLLKIASPIIRRHVRAWLISAVTWLVLYITACVMNQTPAVQRAIIWLLTAAQGFIPVLAGIITNGQINPAHLASVLWILLSVTILPALLRIPWIQKNQLATELIRDAETVAAAAPPIASAPAQAVIPLPAAAQAQANPQEPIKQP